MLNHEKRNVGKEPEIEKQTILASVNQKNRKRLCVSTQIINQQDYLNKFDIEKDGSIHEQRWAKNNINKFYKRIRIALIR
jgi:hypothetical protein